MHARDHIIGLLYCKVLADLSLLPISKTRREIVTHFLISGSDLSTVPELFLPFYKCCCRPRQAPYKAIATARKSVLSLDLQNPQLSSTLGKWFLTVSQYHTLCFLTKNYHTLCFLTKNYYMNTCSRGVLITVATTWLYYLTFEQTHCDLVWVTAVCDCQSVWVTAVYTEPFGISTEALYLPPLFDCYMAGATWNCCRLDACSVYIIKPCTSLQCRIIRSHILRMHVCLAVTCYLHYWLV